MADKYYAVNMCDWMAHVDDIGLHLLLKPVISKEKGHVECEPGRIDGMSLPLLCDKERARAILEIIRKNYQKYQLRMYYGSGSTWKKV